MPVAVSNVVRIRNKYRINTPFVEDAKILFSSRYTYNPPNPPVGRGYPLDAFYDRVGTIGFFLDNSDYFNTNLGRVSMMSSTSMFPVTLDTIDCSQLPHVHANAQTDISGKDVTIEYVKGGTFTQTAGWPACQPQATGGSCPYVCNATTLPAGLYQIWNATVTFDGVSYPVQLAMPDDNSNPGLNPAFVDPNRLFNFRTEFFESGMFVQFLLWDMQVQSDGSSTWVPVTQFKQEEPAGSTFNSAGVRVTVYNNRPVLEVSNDGSDTYHFLNDQFSIPADVSGVPSAEPRIEFTDSINWVFNDQSALTLVARLNRTSTSDVNVALKITGTAAGMSYINNDFSNPTILTIPAGSLTGSITFNLGGSFPSGTDYATIFMTRSCNGMIGTVPAEKVTFVNLPRRPHLTQKYDFGVQGPFSNYDFFVTINTVPSQDFSPLMQYNFEAGVGGKVGLHLASGQKLAEFTASDVSATVASSPISSSCQRFSTGTSCSTGYSWVAGREYRLRLAPLAADDRDWKATVMDMETAVETEIGRIHLADAAPYTGFGGLLDDSKRPNGFVDWFSSTNACGTFSAAKVTWRGPYASDGRYNPTRAEVVYGSGSCPQSNGSSLGCPLFTSDLGGSTVRSVAEGTNVWAAAPCSSSTLTNDDFDAAKLITSLPYGDEVNTLAAAPPPPTDDPTTSGGSCGASQHSATVWYKYTPSATGQLRVSAVGSNYDTILAVWTGTRGHLKQVKCNHHNSTNAGNESEFDFQAAGGTTYYVELAGYRTAGGGVGSVRVYPKP